VYIADRHNPVGWMLFWYFPVFPGWMRYLDDSY